MLMLSRFISETICDSGGDGSAATFSALNLSTTPPKCSIVRFSSVWYTRSIALTSSGSA